MVTSSHTSPIAIIIPGIVPSIIMTDFLNRLLAGPDDF